jgi:FkbM family methyltransferase
MSEWTRPGIAGLVKAAMPRTVRGHLWRAKRWWLRRRGRPFPFCVSEPHAQRSLNCCIASNQYGAYCLPISGLHRRPAMAILSGEVWEPDTIDMIVSHCQSGDIIHAGTFYGDFLPPLAAATVRAGGKVWGFEPNPESYRCAAITLQLNQIGNVELINAGLGEQSDRRFLVTQQGNVVLSATCYILPNPDDAGSMDCSTVSVQIVAIDDIIPEDRSVSVIHLDLEGYEELALTGAIRTIRKSRPMLIIETVPSDAWISENLLPLGYRITEKVSGNSVFRADQPGAGRKRPLFSERSSKSLSV